MRSSSEGISELDVDKPFDIPMHKLIFSILVKKQYFRIYGGSPQFNPFYRGSREKTMLAARK